MKCPVCQNKIQKNWKHCPECGIRLDEAKLEHEGYSIDRIKRLWEIKGGESFYKNFKSVESLGALPYMNVKPIRPTLGDFVNIHFSNIKTFSLLSIQPKCIGELCGIFRMLGYYSADYGLENTKLSKIVDIISKTGLFWKILANQEIQKALMQGWEGTHQGIVELVSVDSKSKQVAYSIDEGQPSYLESDKPLDFIDLELLGGNLEAVCNMKCIGEERLEGDKRQFTYQLHPMNEEMDYPIIQIDNTEYEGILGRLVDYIVHKKPSGRVKLEDKVHISGEQVETYFMLTASEGHQILEKYSGIKCGKKIAEKASLKGLDENLEYLQELFQYYKLGLLHPPETKGDRMAIRMDESIYASGVNNIHMKLDVWLAGLIEGTLNQSTGERWLADETQCLANGDEHCQFTCKKIT